MRDLEDNMVVSRSKIAPHHMASFEHPVCLFSLKSYSFVTST